jgi:hypothetical protein
VAGEVVDGSVGSVGGVCSGGVVPSAEGAGAVAPPATGASVAGPGTGVVAAASAVAWGAASAAGASFWPEQAASARAPAAAAMILCVIDRLPAIVRRTSPAS